MAIKYLKKAIKSPSTDDHETRANVQKILNDLEISREKGIKEISKKFDKYEGEVVSFGTEAGLFQEIGISTVVCGPGSIEQAHKVDEFIELNELKKFLGKGL